MLQKLALGFLLVLTSCQESSITVETTPFPENVRNSYQLAEQWFTEQMREDKSLFHYLYDPKRDEYSTKNNPIRQLMASRLLAELASEHAELLPEHRRNLAFIFENWYKPFDPSDSSAEAGRAQGDTHAAIVFDGTAKLGSNAMALRALVWSPLFDEYKEQAHMLAEGITDVLNADGSFDPWLIAPATPYDANYLLTFYSGEAILALLEYEEKTGDKKYLDAAVRAEDHYVARYVTEMEQNYYPAYVPWHTMSLAKLWKASDPTHSLVNGYVTSIFALNDKLLELQDTSDVVGRFYNPLTPQYGNPHSSSDGVYTEGLAYAYEVARDVGDTVRAERYRRALELAVQHLISLQYTTANTSHFSHPERAIGGFRISKDRSDMRIDSTQHTMDAFRKLLAVLSS